MTVEILKQELAAMPAEQQSHLMAFLVHLRHQRDAAFQSDVSERVGDRAPSHWLSVDELRAHWKKPE